MNTETYEIKNVCVFAGSSPGERDIYSETAKELAQKLSEMQLLHGIVYGGGSNEANGHPWRQRHQCRWLYNWGHY